MSLFDDTLVAVRGAGDLGSGVVYRLRRSGFPVVVAELARPLVIRRPVSFAEAVYASRATVEGITAARVAGPHEARLSLQQGLVPVVVDPAGDLVRTLEPVVIVDARLAKTTLDTRLDDASLVIGLGPGFTAGCDCHAVVETMRGHTLGRVIWDGPALADTGVPDGVAGHAQTRVLRAPAAGRILPHAQIGDTLSEGDLIAEVAPIDAINQAAPIRAQFTGTLRGLIHHEVEVTEGAKIGDLDPRGRREYCYMISDKALAVGGGVLEAILAWRQATRPAH